MNAGTSTAHRIDAGLVEFRIQNSEFRIRNRGRARPAPVSSLLGRSIMLPMSRVILLTTILLGGALPAAAQTTDAGYWVCVDTVNGVDRQERCTRRSGAI